GVIGEHCANGAANVPPPAFTSQYYIPTDPALMNFDAPRASMPSEPSERQFTMWGGTITNVQYVGDVHVGEERQIKVTFTADVPSPVLAWGGHVAWRGDWGPNNSAGGISGSPYHMRLIGLNGSGGNQDLSLSADAVLVPGVVTIIKRAFFGVDEIFPDLEFGFNASGPGIFEPSSFALNPAGTSSIDDTVLLFGASNYIDITEDGIPGNWTLFDLTCVEVGDVGFPSTPDSTWLPGTDTVRIIVQEAEQVTCTFNNALQGTTAALGSITGRVTNATGIGISGATLTLVNAGTGHTVRAITNPFGYYTFENMEVEELYILSVGHKRHNFLDSQRVFTLDGDLVGIDFTSTW